MLTFNTANLDHKRAKFKECSVDTVKGEESRGKTINDPKAVHRDIVEVDFDLLIGADGAHSVTRQQLSRYAKINFQQTWVDILWCEFLIPSHRSGGFQLSSDHLHLWPQKSCMFITSPNMVRSLYLLFFLDNTHTNGPKRTAPLPVSFSLLMPSSLNSKPTRPVL